MGWWVNDGKDFLRPLLFSSIGFGHLKWTNILIWLMPLSFNFAPKFLIYTVPGKRPGEGGRVRRKAELPSSGFKPVLGLGM